MGEMVTARVDEHGRLVRLYLYVGQDEGGSDIYRGAAMALGGEEEDVVIAPGAEPPRWRSVTAAGLAALLEAEDRRRALAELVAVGPEHVWGGPSEAAYRAAEGEPDGVRAELRAAHDPALGLDRSVCLRDVVEALKARHPERGSGEHHAAEFREREFGGAS